MSKNPYRAAEEIGAVVSRVTLYTLCAVSVLGVLALFVWGAWVKDGWGAWALLIIPGVAVGLFLIGCLIGLSYVVKDWLDEQWQSARRRWDAKHASSSSTKDGEHGAQ